jgi:predicted phosphoribosyltransferase
MFADRNDAGRRLPFPHNPESGFGAVAEAGTTVLLYRAVWPLSPDTVQEVIDSLLISGPWLGFTATGRTWETRR